MLAKRAAVTAVLLPIGLVLIWLGGWAYIATIALIMCLAAREYVHLFQTGGLKPAGVLIIAGTLALVIARAVAGFSGSDWIISLLVLAGMTWHLAAYERGRDQAGTDFGVSMAGVLYFGWIGAYLVSLRQLPQGLWWVLLALPTVWLADSGAYFVGRGLGRHKLSPRLSPKKTWEGYFGGILFGVLGGLLLAVGLAALAGPGAPFTPLQGVILGVVLSVFPTLGDLGESMIKRQVGVKDSGKILRAHGGMFDRIDSWLWGAVLGFYLVAWVIS